MSIITDRSLISSKLSFQFWEIWKLSTLSRNTECAIFFWATWCFTQFAVVVCWLICFAKQWLCVNMQEDGLCFCCEPSEVYRKLSCCSHQMIDRRQQQGVTKRYQHESRYFYRVCHRRMKCFSRCSVFKFHRFELRMKKGGGWLRRDVVLRNDGWWRKRIGNDHHCGSINIGIVHSLLTREAPTRHLRASAAAPSVQPMKAASFLPSGELKEGELHKRKACRWIKNFRCVKLEPETTSTLETWKKFPQDFRNHHTHVLVFCWVRAFLQTNDVDGLDWNFQVTRVVHEYNGRSGFTAHVLAQPIFSNETSVKIRYVSGEWWKIMLPDVFLSFEEKHVSFPVNGILVFSAVFSKTFLSGVVSCSRRGGARVLTQGAIRGLKLSDKWTETCVPGFVPSHALYTGLGKLNCYVALCLSGRRQFHVHWSEVATDLWDWGPQSVAMDFLWQSGETRFTQNICQKRAEEPRKGQVYFHWVNRIKSNACGKSFCGCDQEQLTNFFAFVETQQVRLR